jgi:deoxyribodipyrimidine photo-lyase
MSDAAALVWFKRDLRLRDHAPLAEAARFGQALGLVVIEPEWLRQPRVRPRHLGFAAGGVQPLRSAIWPRAACRCWCAWAHAAGAASAAPGVRFTHLLSHEETGPGWSYARDRAVAAGAAAQGVAWREWPQTGVVRRLRTRRAGPVAGHSA